MGTIIYTAKRSLAPGHLLGDEYGLEIGIMDDAQRSTAVEKETQRALGGATETLRHRSDVNWTLTLEPQRGVDMPFLREFLDSTDGGEPFRMDIYGQYGQFVNVRRTDSGYTESPFMRAGSAADDWFTVAIEVVEI